jgi:hypothetical protein
MASRVTHSRTSEMSSHIKSDSISDNPVPDEPKSTKELRLEAVNGIFQIGQFACLAFGQFADAGAIGLHGPGMAQETVELADQNPKIAKYVDLLIEVGPYAGLIGAALPFIAQLMVNHGLFKAEAFANAGVVSPDSLESEMKTILMQKQMEAMRKQREMEDELHKMAEEMQSNNGGNRNEPMNDE